MHRKKFRLKLIAIALGLVFLFGCSGGGSKTPAPAPSSGGEAPQGQDALAGLESVPAIQEADSEAEKVRIAELIRGAQAEGAFNWYGTMIEPDQGEAMLNAFKAHYGLDNVKVEYTYASPGEMVTKVEELLRSGRHNLDVVWNTAYSWMGDLHDRGLLAEYHSPAYEDYTISEMWGANKEGYWVSDSYSFHPMYNIEIMKDMMGADWNPDSWNDFVDPRLHDQLTMGDMMLNESHAGMAQGVVKVMGKEYFAKLKEQVNPVVFGRAAQGRDWVATGEYPVTLSSHAKNAYTLKTRGEEGIRLVYPKEGIIPLPFTLVILESAPNPNAAKLFVDFARSTKGQETVLNAGGLIFSGRPGVKSPDPEILPPPENITWIPFDWNTEGTDEALEELRALWVEIGLDR